MRDNRRFRMKIGMVLLGAILTAASAGVVYSTETEPETEGQIGIETETAVLPAETESEAEREPEILLSAETESEQETGSDILLPDETESETETLLEGFMEELQKGRALKAGDKIAITAPAGSTNADFSEIYWGIASLGYRVVTYPTVTTYRDGYFAGTAKERAEELMKLFQDDTVDAILCLRGGYGSPTILDLLDYEEIGKHPKLFIGFSDITALLNNLAEKSGIVTIHGPMISTLHPQMEETEEETVLTGSSEAETKLETGSENHEIEETEAESGDGTAVYDGTEAETEPQAVYNLVAEVKIDPDSGLGLPEGSVIRFVVPETQPDPEAEEARMEAERQEKADQACTWEAFQEGLTRTEPIGEVNLPENCLLETIVPGKAEGRIVGGNLSLLSALCGTAYELDGTGCILFIEEVGEHAYRIDRMLEQLRLNGLFDRVSGVIYGEFDSCTDGAFTVDEVIERYAKMTGKPTVKGLPTGHASLNLILPIGVHASLTAKEEGDASFVIDEAYAKE